MPVTLHLSASTPNVAFTYMQFIVSGSTSGSNYTENQYKFIMDVYESGSSNYIARLKQPPNKGYSAVFNPADVFQENVEFDPVWEITGSVVSTGSLKNYVLQFGEQYGTSPSSSITAYPNQVTYEMAIIPGVDNSNDFGIGIFDFQIPLESEVLTDMPSATDGTGTRVSGGDWENITYLELDDYMTLSTIHTGSVEEARIIVSDNEGTDLAGITTNFPTGTLPFTVNHFGCGPKNIIERGDALSTAIQNVSASYVTVVFDVQGTGQDIQYRLSPNYGSLPQSGAGGLNKSTFNKPDQCGEKTRFAWINRYGVYDYYSVYNPVRKRTEIEKEQITESRINYWLNPTTVGNLNIGSQKKEGRGLTDLYKKYKDIYQISTTYLPEVKANWMKFMFFSPSVYIQTDNGFVPIIITNNQYKVNTTQASNKLFQYDIEFVYANARRSNNYVGKLEYDAQ